MTIDPTPPVVMDTDPVIPTGVPATPERVAELIADPYSHITEDVIPLLVEEQQPTQEQIDAAYAARGEEAIPHEEEQ